MRHSFLETYRHLPDHNDDSGVVQWHVFRDATEADDYAASIILGEGQRIVGGVDSDSVGKLWWVGVEVEDIGRWGNRAAVNKHAE